MKPLESEEYTDVVELCALLQCLNYNVKSLDISDANMSQDGGTAKTIVINCQSSGLHVILENSSAQCSCPVPAQQNSGFWQMEAVSGGKQIDKECGSVLLGSFSKSFKDRLSMELQSLVKSIKRQSDSNAEADKTDNTNEIEFADKSASMGEIKTTPEKRLVQMKSDTPTRYRSLDTLTNNKVVGVLPPPGELLKHTADTSADDVQSGVKRPICRRQSTYTINSTPGATQLRNKTSSPIQAPHNTMLENLIAAEKAAEELRNKLTAIIKDVAENKDDSSMSSLVLDVSKISVLKGVESSRTQFVSSPNLSGLHTVHEDVLTKSKLKRFESASTSNLAPSGSTPKEGGSKLVSQLKRLSPNIFNRNKSNPTPKTSDAKTKLGPGLMRPRIITPVRVPRVGSESSPNLSGSKKKFSHVKSTIPRPSSVKKE